MTGKEAKEKLEKINKYKNDFQREKYDRVSVLLPKGMRDAIKAKSGESLNGLINRLLSEYLEQ